MGSYSEFLPSYSIGDDVYDKIGDICSSYGKKIVAIGGKTSTEKTKEYIQKAVENTDLEILDFIWYGGEASYENGDTLIDNETLKKADMVFAIGGGKSIDTAKYVASKLGKPIFAFPTIAATCAASSAICVMYYPNGTMKDVFNPDRPAVHVFINTKIIAEAPDVYLWAGIGDTIAKHYAVAFSARGDELDHSDGLALAMSTMCVDPIIKYGKQAYDDCKNNVFSHAIQEVCLDIIITTGLVSNLVDSYKYNTCIEHSLFYGFTKLHQIEERHLHGEVVAYGLLVLLMIDKQLDTIDTLYKLYKDINLPTRLSDIEVEYDELDPVLDKALSSFDVEHVPYPLTREMTVNAMKELDKYNDEH